MMGVAQVSLSVVNPYTYVLKDVYHRVNDNFSLESSRQWKRKPVGAEGRLKVLRAPVILEPLLRTNIIANTVQTLQQILEMNSI